MLGEKTFAASAIDQANVAYAEAIAQQRTSPGVLLFTQRRELLYTNQEALDFSARLFNGSRPLSTQGLLAPVILSLCEELTNHMQACPDPKGWEQFQLKRVLLVPPNPMLLRGIGIPASRSLLILIENLSEHQRTEVAVDDSYKLSSRERAVINFLTLGLTNKQIADRLRLSEHTIKDHLKHIMRKMRARTRTGVLARLGYASVATAKPRATRTAGKLTEGMHYSAVRESLPAPPHM